MPGRVVVLEDDIARIDWLEGVLAGTGVKPEWCPTVRAFREAMALPGAVDLVILDHDLGPHSLTSEDTNGETGLDAARWLPDALAATVPVLVWSVNPTGAEEMRRVLVERGFAVRKCAFTRDNRWALRRIVVGVLGAEGDASGADASPSCPTATPSTPSTRD